MALCAKLASCCDYQIGAFPLCPKISRGGDSHVVLVDVYLWKRLVGSNLGIGDGGG